MSPTEVATVGVVGAGPVGLACAARLRSFGVRCVVLESRPRLLEQGTKACLIQGDVLEILDKLGCGDQIALEGVRWHIAHTYVRGHEVTTTTYPNDSAYGPFINISQFRIEQLLLARLEELGGEVRWSHRVERVRQSHDRVTVEAETPSGPQQMEFRYVVACDGIRSTMRDLLALEWNGYTHDARFLITDIRARLSLPKERQFHFDAPSNPGRQIIIHAQPDDTWRIDWQLAPGADIDAEKRTGQLDRRIRAVIGDAPYEIEWMSVYRFHQRVVDRFRVGRILLAGDAAHVLPPYGARGMNSGIQDADNLAWKLALVCRGRAPDELLDTYHDERYAAALENLRITEDTIRFMVPPTRFRGLVRRGLFWLSRRLESARAHLDSGKMAEPYVYSTSGIIDGASGEELVGVFAPDLPLRVEGTRTRLRKLLGAGFVCVYFGERGSWAEVPPEVPPTFGTDPGLRLVVVLPEHGADDREQEARAGVTVALRRGLRTAGYHADGHWYLVRPDGHIASTGRSDGRDLQVEARRAMRRATGAMVDTPLGSSRPRRASDSARRGTTVGHRLDERHLGT